MIITYMYKLQHGSIYYLLAHILAKMLTDIGPQREM